MCETCTDGYRAMSTSETSSDMTGAFVLMKTDILMLFVDAKTK